MTALRALALAGAVLAAAPAAAQPDDPATSPPPREENDAPGRGGTIARFLGGAALGLGLHEGGHLLLDVAFDADPGLDRVSFGGIPFFAITHRPDLPPGREYAISSAGFWMQHASSEWLLTRRPGLRRARAPAAKGLLAFNVIASAAYSGAAFVKAGPPERDTRAMAGALGIDERWVGVMILAPAALDAWRYRHPDARWAAWSSRAAKIGLVVLLARAAR